MIVAFRRHTLLPLDDSLYALQPNLPHLTRSSPHRCLQRHGISRLPDVDGDKFKRSRFKAYPIGYFHIDIAQVSTEQGKLHLFVAIDRTSKFAFVQLHEKATQRIAAAFLHDLVAAAPYTIHTVLTDNGIRFADNHPMDEEAEAKAAAYWATQDWPRIYRWHAFDWACEQTKIEHRLTRPRCPWTNGQVDRMNRTIKDATVKRYHYASHDELRLHLQPFVDA
ncbi:Integrase core domain-containing protein [Methylobacterium sp. 275MFSha3.1]|nr:Integrase core domain-containing protein [Methylobacterium sp. 275MFSha3.1]